METMTTSIPRVSFTKLRFFSISQSDGWMDVQMEKGGTMAKWIDGRSIGRVVEHRDRKTNGEREIVKTGNRP